jgi:hypothetical protein
VSVIFLVALLGLPQSTERRELLVVYGGVEPTNFEEAVRNFAGFRFESVKLLEAEVATRDDLSRGALALVGTSASNRWLRELSSKLPVLARQAEEFAEPGDSIALRTRNPLNPEAPLFVVTGNSNGAVRDALGGRRRADVHVRRNGKTLVLVTYDPEAVRRFSVAAKPALSTERFDYFIQGGTGPSLELLAAANEALMKSIARQFPLRPVRLEIHLYPSLEEKGLVTDDTRVAHLEGDALHAVLGIDRTPERLLVERILEVPDRTVRRGLASVLVGDDLDENDRTARRLLETSDPPKLSALEGESPYVVDALTTSFARFVLDARGPEAFASPERGSLENDWRADLLRKTFPDAPGPGPPETFQRGFTFAHEGFNIDNGYLSSRGERSLERLSGLGIDAVAIVPYAFMRDPLEIAPLSVPERPGSETDEEVTQAIATAKAKGMTVLLKPQIWIRRSWPGEIETKTPEDEERFFDEYGRWIRHYALMAERHGVEILAIGTELSKMTLGRKARWEALVEDVRSVYRGKLVYAANWGAEVEHVEFWPLLDYVGVDFYYPLSSEDAPEDGELRREFESALDEIQAVSRRHGKPVLLTEIGYASTKSPWKSPHASDRQRELAPEDQARAYRIAFEALADETDWIRGTYWWKWPTDLARGGPSDRGFTPNGKPAEDVVRAWYRDRLR